MKCPICGNELNWFRDACLVLPKTSSPDYFEPMVRSKFLEYHTCENCGNMVLFDTEKFWDYKCRCRQENKMEEVER